MKKFFAIFAFLMSGLFVQSASAQFPNISGGDAAGFLGAVIGTIIVTEAINQQNESADSGTANQGSPGAQQSQFSRSERMDIQRALNARGFNVGAVDGVLGSKSIAAIRSFQVSIGARSTGSLTRQQFGALVNQTQVASGSIGSSSSPGSFEVLMGYDLPGNDFRHSGTDQTLKHITANQCQAACQNDAICRAYTYNLNANWCFLKTSASSPIPFEGAVSGRRGGGSFASGSAAGGPIIGGSGNGFNLNAVPGQARELGPDEIRLLQRSLNDLGYNAGRVDGVLGRGTRGSLRRFLIDFGHSEFTPDVEALRLVAEKAGYSDQITDTIILGYSAERAEHGEVSIFSLDENTLTSDDFAEATRQRESTSLDISQFLLFSIDNMNETDRQGMAALVAMVIAANPSILEDLEVVRSLYKFEGGTYTSSYRVGETLGAFREELEQRTAPTIVRLALTTGGNLGVGSYDRSRGVFPIDYLLNPKIQSFMTLHLPLLGDNYSKYDIDFSLPELPDLSVIPMTLEQAEALERQYLVADFNSTDTFAYIEVTGISFDANRNKYVTHAQFRGADVRSRFRDDEVTYYQWVPDTDSVNAGAISGAVDLADFMGELNVYNDHIALDGTDGWQKIADALLLSALPQVMEDTKTAIRIGTSLLTSAEQFSVWEGAKPDLSVSNNEFDLLDTAERLRAQFGETLQQRAVDTPFKMVQIRSVSLDRYNFENGAYGMRLNRDKEIRFARSSEGAMELNATLGNTFLPQYLEIPEDLARQLDGVMRAKGNRRFFLAIYSDVTGMSEPVADSSRYGNRYSAALETNVTRIALFADSSLTKLVFDFYRDGDLKQLQDRSRSVFEVYEIASQNRESLIVTARDLMSDPEVVVQSVRTSDEFEQANEIQRPRVQSELLARFNQTRALETFWLNGSVRLGAYDLETQTFAIAGIGISEARSVVRLEAEIIHEFVNYPQSVSMAIEEAELLLERFSDRQFFAKFEVTPVSASWEMHSFGYPEVTIASHITQIYMLNDDGRRNDREKEIVFDLPFDPYIPFSGVSEGVERAFDASVRQVLNQDLLAQLAVSEFDGELSERSLRWLMANRWLYDTGRVKGLSSAFFNSDDSPPTSARFSALKPAFVEWLNMGEPTVPDAVSLVFETSNHRLYLRGSGGTVLIDRDLRANQCHYLGYLESNVSEALAEHLGLGPIRSFLSEQNSQIYSGSDENPTIIQPAIFEFLDSPLNCTSRTGENLADDFVGDDYGDYQPNFTIVFDRLPVPPSGSPKQNMVLVDARVEKVEFLDNGNDTPHVVIFLEFEQAKTAWFDDGEISVVSTIESEQISASPTVAADGSALDVVGVELGMSEAEAETIIAAHFGEFDILTSQAVISPQMEPFHDVKMYVAANHQERIALFFEEGSKERVVLGVERVVSAPDWGLPRQAVVAAARRKYGEPASLNITEYNTEMRWGLNVAAEDVYRTTKCNAVARSERIDDWVDQAGTSHKIYEYFNWEQARDSGMTDLPGLDYYLQDEFAVYQRCGTYVRLEQNSRSLRTLLVDLKVYARDYLETRRLIEESFASDEPENLGTEIKL